MNEASLEQVTGTKCGDVIAGKYRILRLIGAGGMGCVVSAEHVHLGEKVAIKFLNAEGLRNPDVVARFGQEARAAVKIKNEHVARVIDVATLESGTPYIVMEYLEGIDLSDTIEQLGRVNSETAVGYILQACEAIAEAHCAGIIHRDLKPANLFCVKRVDGSVCIKVLDFGISKLPYWKGEAVDAAVTKTAAVFGSPLYMSPEQMRSTKNVDARADIWSIGVILYELLTGRVPFDGDSMPQVCSRVSCEPPPPMDTEQLALPDGLTRVVFRCLEKDRANRYPNIAELAADLLPYGPKYCGHSVERIVRTIESAGLGRTRTPATSADGYVRESFENETFSPPIGKTKTVLVRNKFWFGTAAGIAIGLVGLVVLWKVDTRGSRGIPPDALSNTAAATREAVSTDVESVKSPSQDLATPIVVREDVRLSKVGTSSLQKAPTRGVVPKPQTSVAPVALVSAKPVIDSTSPTAGEVARRSKSVAPVGNLEPTPLPPSGQTVRVKKWGGRI